MVLSHKLPHLGTFEKQMHAQRITFAADFGMESSLDYTFLLNVNGQQVTCDEWCSISRHDTVLSASVV